MHKILFFWGGAPFWVSEPTTSNPQRQPPSQTYWRLTAMCPDSGRWGQFRQLIPLSVHAIAGALFTGNTETNPSKILFSSQLWIGTSRHALISSYYNTGLEGRGAAL